MPVLAQRIKLFARDVPAVIQPQSLRTNADPLAGTDFTRRVVIILRQVFYKVTFGGGQLLMDDGAEHTKRRYQAPRGAWCPLGKTTATRYESVEIHVRHS